QPVRAMLAHDHRDRRQLGLLAAPEAARGLALLGAEAMAAAAAGLRVVVDDLVDPLLRGKLAARAAVPRLPARLALTLPFRPRLRLLARLRAPLPTRARKRRLNAYQKA